jgi:uncharacterized protein (TIGR00297 family)
MTLADGLLYTFLLLGAVLSYTTSKLTLAGAITGTLTGLLIYKGAGYTGIGMLALFFIAGSWATSWQIKRKAAIGAEEKRKGQRTAGQVMANGGMAALLGALAWYLPVKTQLLQLMMAGSLAAATADTLSSELGTVYGSRFYNVLNFKKDKRGLDGVISLEGTLIGLAGAVLIAVVYAVGFGWSISFCWIMLAGLIGNLADSVLGATLERKQLIGNNTVNFLNTLTGALICLLLSKL